MKVEIITLFPSIFDALREEGIVARAHKRGLVEFGFWNPRDFVDDKWKRVDDRPFGGGPGMVMMYEPLANCIRALKKNNPKIPIYYLSPQGKQFNQNKARKMCTNTHFALLCGRYEGIDQRVIDAFVCEELSIGPFVLSGGELAAMSIIDACARLIPGVLGNDASSEEDSFGVDGSLDCPHYTRPDSVDGMTVPSVLLSGDHRRIVQWRRYQSLLATQKKLPQRFDATMAEELTNLQSNFTKDSF